MFDANPPPGIEMLGSRVETDRGSGSFAEDGRLEVAEDETMNNGEMSESSLMGQAAVDGQSEIGQYAEEGASEIGQFALDGASEIGQAAVDGQSEIGQFAEDGASEIGQYAEDGASEIGQYALDGASEIGQAAVDGQSEIGLSGGEFDDVLGSYAMYGPTEIGGGIVEPHGGIQSPFESFMLDDTGIGAEMSTPVAVAKVIEKARDNRQPPPPMKAVDVDAPMDDSGLDEDVAEFLVGAAMTLGHDAFPLTTQFMQRCGAGCPPRFVRVDTEESYQQFRTEHSPEMSELAEKVAHLSAKVDDHINDPNAHEGGYDDDLSADIDDLTILGEEVAAAEQAKHVELWMPKRYQGLITAWREGDYICASLMLPGKDGTVKVCTSLEPVVKCVEEMARHAAESGASETVVGHLPAMGCVLGAGTVLKEVAAAAPAILDRPEAKGSAPFVVRIEPKLNPAVSALAMLAMACKSGNAQACKEWSSLAKHSPAPVRQAMQEGLALAKSAA
jgi:hypothetical protein